ncbi:MAG: plasmid replication protein, CyRepA1 family [Microcystaceae cyanobacterium]
MNTITINTSNITTDFVNFAKVYRQLKAEHGQEWLDSAVNVDIIRLNVESLQGNQSFNHILYSDDIPRRNDGRVTDSILQRYRHLEEGGWYCSGIDPLTGQASDWGCFKPDQPYIQSERKGFGEPVKQKLIKYEHPFKTPTELFCLRIPLTLWQLIADRYQLPLPENIIVDSTGEALGFWQWVIEQSVPIVITEGAKKAGALLSAGYVAIALPGIYNGYRTKDKKGNLLLQPELIPQLKIFCQTQREFIFCFDQDSKPTAAKNVQTAIAKTGKLLKATGCSVSVMSWYLPHKGIDDLIVAQGAEYLDYLWAQRQTLREYQRNLYTSLNPYISLRIKQRFLTEDLQVPESARIIGLKSPKGTGKSEWLANRIISAVAQDIAVIVIVHREQLAKELAQRFGIEYRTEVTPGGRLVGYTLCVDSLHSKANPPFHPDSWENCWVFIDECEQVFWHLLHSPTCQYARPAILDTLTQLLNRADRIFLSDADLTRIAINYANSLLEEPSTPWVVVNEYRPPNPRRLCNYASPEALYADLVNSLQRGDRLIIHTGAQKHSSKWGTSNLAQLLQHQFPDLKILVIDQETVGTAGHPAWGCMGKLNQVLPLYDVVIASPTLETGVSIDVPHFHRVFGFFSGVQTVEAVCQSLARVRDDIPRHVYIPERSTQRIGNGSEHPHSLLKSQDRLFQVNVNLLSQANPLLALEGHSPQHLQTWAMLAANHNYGFKNYRQEILKQLEAEGYEVISSDSLDPDEAQEIKTMIKESTKANYRQHRENIASAPVLSLADYEQIKNAKTKTSAERLSERKTDLVMRYGLEDISPELIEADDRGLYGKLRMEYYLTVGNEFLTDRDLAKIEKLAPDGQVFLPDFNRVTLTAKIQALKILNLEQFLDPHQFHTGDSLAEWFKRVLACREDIRNILGISIHPERDTPISVAQRMLNQLFGTQMTCIQQKRLDERKRIRIYAMTNPNAHDRQQIFEHWRERDQQNRDLKEAREPLS